jgi:hypothetical protein
VKYAAGEVVGAHCATGETSRLFAGSRVQNFVQESIGDLVAVSLRSDEQSQFLAFHRSEIVESVKSPLVDSWIKVRQKKGAKIETVLQRAQAVFQDGSVAIDLEFEDGPGLYVVSKKDVEWPTEIKAGSGGYVIVVTRDRVNGTYKQRVRVGAAFADGSVVLDEPGLGRLITPSHYEWATPDDKHLANPYVYVNKGNKFTKVKVAIEYENGSVKITSGEVIQRQEFLTFVNLRETDESVYTTGKSKVGRLGGNALRWIHSVQ